MCTHHKQIYSLCEETTHKNAYFNLLQKKKKLHIELEQREAFNAKEVRVSKHVPTTLLKKQIQKTQLELNNAKAAYATCNLADYSYVIHSSKSGDASEDDDFKQGIFYEQAIFDLSDERFRAQKSWEPWPDDVKKNVDFTSVMKHVGDGEQRIGYIFGGSIMGGNKSYDIVVPHKGRWEVKDVTKSEIRLANSKLCTFLTKRLSTIIEQLLAFCNILEEHKSNEATILSLRDEKMAKYIEQFVLAEYSTFSDCISVTRNKFLELKKVVTYASLLKKKMNSSTHAAIIDDYFFENIDHISYVRAIKVLSDVCKTTLTNFNGLDLATEVLRDPVFDNPKNLVKLVHSIKLSDALGSRVEGIILVHKDKGFFVIRREHMDEQIVFSRIAQGKLNFNFVETIDENNQSKLSDRTVSDVPGSVEYSGTSSENVLQV